MTEEAVVVAFFFDVEDNVEPLYIAQAEKKLIIMMITHALKAQFV